MVITWVSPQAFSFDPAAVPGRRRGQRQPIAGFLSERERPMYRRYLAWANSTGKVACGRGRHARSLLSVVVDILVDGWSYRRVERSLGLRHGGGHAQAMLRFALAAYGPDERRRRPRGWTV